MNDPLHLFDLSGRVACVTGASSGLGRRAASILAEAGAKVIGIGRRQDALENWQEETGENAAYLVADVTKRNDMKDLADAIATPFGSPDILINAAGLNKREPADLVSANGWDETLAVNLSAPFFLAQALVPSMQANGWRRIVNFASLQSSRAFGDSMAYGASKGGVAQLTRAMAEAWSSQGINVNAIGPGFFPTELTKPVFDNPDLRTRHASQTCIGRNGQESDLDGPLLFFCSEASAYVTGQILMVDGGYTAK